jgi:predicted component of type VI protein secretion system
LGVDVCVVLVQVTLTNYSAVNPTLVNGQQSVGLGEGVVLQQGDVFTIGDRAFRFQYNGQSHAHKIYTYTNNTF